MAQTFSAFELLVLDDSPEGSAIRDVTASYHDSRIHFFPSAHLGVARNHNRGLLASKGPLVAIINHDDVWEPDLLDELATALLASPGSVVAFSDHLVIDAQGVVDVSLTEEVSRRWGRAELEPGLHLPFGQLATVDQTIPIAQAAVWKRTSIPLIPAWAGDHYDYWIGSTLGSSGQGAVYIPRRLARFRVHQNNLGGSRPLKRRLGGVRFYRQLLKENELSPYRRHLRKRYRLAMLDLAKWPADKALERLSSKSMTATPPPD